MYGWVQWFSGSVVGWLRGQQTANNNKRWPRRNTNTNRKSPTKWLTGWWGKALSGRGVCHLEAKRIYDACYRAARTTRRQTMTKGGKQKGKAQNGYTQKERERGAYVCKRACVCVSGRRTTAATWKIKSANTKSIAYFSAGARKTQGKHVFIHL